MKKIHFVGIKGVGMAPLAIIVKEAGFIVSGTDTKDEFITDEELLRAGIKSEIGFKKDHVIGADLVITTGAHSGFDNPEVVAAKEMNIPVLTQGEAVGVFMEGKLFGKKFRGISISGCHGKTTTTALIATLLQKAKMDPTYVIGTGQIGSLHNASGHFGKGDFFVAEADEYVTEPTHDRTIKFLWQHPAILVITNIEFDHPDVYKNLEDVTNAFKKLIKNIQNGGVVVANGDDGEVRKVLATYSGKKTTFGQGENNDFVVKNIHIANGKTTFVVFQRNVLLGNFTVGVIGEHNVLNSLAAIAVAMQIGIPVEKIKKGLECFIGTKRRLEYIKKLSWGAAAFDDYAHHPTEIQKTLEAFRSQFPTKKIVCIFQPHTYSRTKKLFKQFSCSFTLADTIILTNIYPSAREQIDPSVSLEDMVISLRDSGKEALFLPSLENVLKYINDKQFDKDTVIITMGAGDIYKIWRNL